MLPHYTTELRNIARKVLNGTGDDGNVLRETLEQCYGQALHTSGALHSDNYFVPLGEARLEWPYDPDFESEEYYEHENRLEIDENYAEAFPSAESISAMPRRSRVSLLSRGTEEITQMLYSHLTKSIFGGKDDDNLMSWSSSLPFVIQYAIWRCYQRRCHTTEVEICAIDTRKFPHGQFVRDKSLLQAYRDSSALNQEMQDFFEFRLRTPDYDNGEYLSQGVVHHAGRSSVVCLAHLIQTGLYDLYPEFADPTKRSLWTNRVRSLRDLWSTEHTTTLLDIERAVNIARECFEGLDTADVALVLLAFKNRKLRGPATKAQVRRGDSGGCGPAEVERYMTIADELVSKDRDGMSGPGLAYLWATSCQLLEEVFECS
ncbi:hypothetical protein N7535_008695 [Penicillium sp. DV-2018c]|nr:hypothetical protein N7461_002454 [Penicillium sp. DV-2018c]KAJ5563531.1 hypothetical protein N7535_008695 [Penicillium sp. DV-2018c]